MEGVAELIKKRESWDIFFYNESREKFEAINYNMRPEKMFAHIHGLFEYVEKNEKREKMKRKKIKKSITWRFAKKRGKKKRKV